MLGLIMHIFQTHHHETVLHVQETRHNNVTSYCVTIIMGCSTEPPKIPHFLEYHIGRAEKDVAARNVSLHGRLLLEPT
jgi:hypothetical protein